MPHWWNQNLTLYRKIRTKDANDRTAISWHREVLHNCFFGTTEKQVFDGATVIKNNSFIVRVPSSCGDIFSRGDVIALGEQPAAEPTISAENSFIINTVKDNSFLRQPHYLGGEA